jgi:hypothetical protein
VTALLAFDLAKLAAFALLCVAYAAIAALAVYGLVQLVLWVWEWAGWLSWRIRMATRRRRPTPCTRAERAAAAARYERRWSTPVAGPRRRPALFDQDAVSVSDQRRGA